MYTRRSNIVISGIPVDRDVVAMESIVIDVLDKIEVPASPRDIEAVHRIGKDKKENIVQFINQKDAVAAIKNRRKLKDLDVRTVGFRKTTKIYIKENICPFLQKIGFMCRKLKRADSIFAT